MKRLDAWIAKLEQTPLTFARWLIGISGILIIRFLLEGISSPPSGVVGSDVDRLAHHYLFFIALGWSLAFVVALFVRGKTAAMPRWILFGMMITWLPPLFDLIVSHGAGSPMNYICEMPNDLLMCYLTFFGPFVDPGITLGMRIEVFLVLAAIVYYVRRQTQSWLKAALAAWLCYTIVFIYFALPSFVLWKGITLAGLFGESPRAVGSFLTTYIALITSGIFYILLFLLGSAWFYWHQRAKCLAVFANSRWERFLHYALIAGVGMMIAAHRTPPLKENLFLGFFSAMLFFVALYLAWMVAVGNNDLADISLDRIANPKRPLVTGALSESEMRGVNGVALTGALLGGYLVGYETLFFIIVFLLAYHVYSMPPLRLKRIPILSSLLIAVATLAIFMAGFFIFSMDHTMRALPMTWVALILVVFTLIANIRDLKDVDGDRAEGILTLPVIFGLERGKKIIGLLIVAAFALVPMILKDNILFWISAPFAAAAYWLVAKKMYREWQLFALYYFYTLLAVAWMTTR